MASDLVRRAGQESKLLAAAKEVEARRNEAKLQLMALAPKVGGVIHDGMGMLGAAIHSTEFTSIALYEVHHLKQNQEKGASS